MKTDDGDSVREVSRARRVVRFALRGGVALVAVILALLGLLHTGPGQNLIRTRVVSALNAKMHGSASLDELQVSLFSGVRLSGLTLRDAAGTEVVRVETLSTKLTLSKLLSGEIAVEHLRLHGVRLALTEVEAGGTNLGTLFKKTPPKPKTTSSKKKSRRISVGQIDVADVGLTLEKLDGSSLNVSGVSLAGHATAVPDDKTVALTLEKIAFGLERKNQGTTLSVADFQSALQIDIVQGSGTVSVKRTAAKLALTRKDKPAFSTPVAFNGVDLEVAPGSLSATLEKLGAGLALLDSLKLSGSAESGALTGDQSAVVAGLSLRKDKLNVLLGKELLASDLSLQAKVGGPPAALSVAVDVQSAGGTLKLSGSVDVSKIERPSYDLTLEGDEIESVKLVHSSAPPITVKKLSLQIKGSEIKKERIDADVELSVERLTVKGIIIDGIKLRGRYERGTVKITSLSIDGLGQKLRADGSFVIATRELLLNLRPSGDVGRALAALSAAGIQIKTKIPPGKIVLLEDETHLLVSGNLNEKLDAEVKQATVRAFGGSIHVRGAANLNKGAPDAEGKQKFALAGFSGDVRLNNVGLASLARLRGKNLQGYDGRINGRVQVSGTKESPKAKLSLSVTSRPDRAGTRRAALVTRVDGKIGARGAEVSVKAVRRDGSGAESDVLSLDANLPLDVARRRLGQHGAPRVTLDLPRRNLSSLRDVLPDSVALKLMKYPDANVEAHAKFDGTAAKPRGSFALDLDTELPLLADAGGHQRLALHGSVTPTPTGSKVKAELGAWLDHRKAKLVDGDIGADLTRSASGTDVAWTAGISVKPPALQSLPAPIRRPGLSGNLNLRADLSGTRRDLQGRLVLSADGVHKGELGPLDLKTQLDVGAAETKFDLKLRAAGLDAVALHGTVGVAGKNLIQTLREKKLGDPALDAELTVVRQRVAKYASLRKKLILVPGEISGRMALTGTVKEPLVNGAVSLDEFVTLNGSPGRVDLRLNAQADALRLRLGVGAPRGGDNPVQLRIEAPRPELIALLQTPEDEQRQLAIQASARASAVPLASLIPSSALDGKALKLTGDLHWNMDAELQLAAKGKLRRLAQGILRGDLRIKKGSASIPNSKRRYHKVELAIVSSADALRIERLSLEERDIEKAKRSLDVSGRVAWKDLRPRGIELSLNAKDWLLFGSSTLGKPDAPRAALTSRIEVRGDLSGARRKVAVTVRKLDLKMPDRYDRAHWPEDTHLGDMLVLGEAGVSLGKLPVPEAVKTGAVHQPPPPKPPPADSIAGGTDMVLSIPNTAKIQKPPFELHAHGKLVVKLRPGLAAPEIRGELPLTGGAMSLGGKLHPIAKGKKSRIVFDDRSPRGRMETHLLRQAEVAAMRDISKASAGGDTVRLYLEGPIGKPVSKVNGAGNADLWDMLPVYNAGRVKWTSQPDLPASVAAQIPRQYDVILLSYMAVNLPHNLFLDRINAWSDPEDVRRGYGQVRNLEAERNSKSGKTRIVTTARPPSAGRSDAELEVDWMWANGARTKAGIGLAAGNRLGGGPAVFFDWSSED